MNTQLALLDIAPEIHYTSHKRSPKKARNNEPWWKLSEEERQRGIQGVQTIRAILAKSSDSDDLFLAQAS